MVTKILRNDRYTGMTTYGRRVRDKVGSTHTVKVEREDWIAVAGTHESIVTQEEFDRGQQALRDFIERGQCAEKDPLARKIRCGVCGHIMTHSNSKEKYYYCRTRLVQNNCACTEVDIPKKDLMAALLNSLHAQAAVAVDLNKLCQEQRKKQRESMVSQLRKLAALHEKKGKVDGEAKDLYERFALGEISQVEYLAGKETLESKKATVAGQVQQLEAVLDETGQPAESYAFSAFQKYADTQEVTPEIMEEALQEVRVYPGERLEILWKYQDELEQLQCQLPRPKLTGI